MRSADLGHELEIWIQWHQLGYDVVTTNVRLTTEQRRVIKQYPEIWHVFEMGMRLAGYKG